MSDVIHMVRLPTPSDAPEAAPAPLPLWHRDVAAIDPEWATEAAGVLELLSSSDYGMVQSNAIGAQGAGSAIAYSNLLKEMQALQIDTVKEQNRPPPGWMKNTWDGFVSMMLSVAGGDAGSLVVRMEKLLRDRKDLVENTRNRLHGLQTALDQRTEVDDRAMALLAQLPELEVKANQALEVATQTLSETPEAEKYEVFRKNQLDHRSAQKVPQALAMVRQQLQNAVMLGAPLRDTIDQFIDIEQTNQNKFELSFSVHVSNLAVLQGLQQSKRNAAASETVFKALPLPEFVALPAPEATPSTPVTLGSVSLTEALNDLLPEYIALQQMAGSNPGPAYASTLASQRESIVKAISEADKHSAIHALALVSRRLAKSDPLGLMLHNAVSTMHSTNEQPAKKAKSDDVWDDFFEQSAKMTKAKMDKEKVKKPEFRSRGDMLLQREKRASAKKMFNKSIPKDSPARRQAQDYFRMSGALVSAIGYGGIKQPDLTNQINRDQKQIVEMALGSVLDMSLVDAEAMKFLVGSQRSYQDPLCKRLETILPHGDLLHDIPKYQSLAKLQEKHPEHRDYQAGLRWVEESITLQISQLDHATASKMLESMSRSGWITGQEKGGFDPMKELAKVAKPRRVLGFFPAAPF